MFISVSIAFYDLYLWQTIVHQIIPNLIIMIISIALLARVLWQKHRKMTVQLLSTLLPYLLFSFPFILVTLMYLSGLSYRVYSDFLPYADFFSYFMILLYPFVCVLSLSELSTKIQRTLQRRQHHARAIQPTAMILRPTIGAHLHDH